MSLLSRLRGPRLPRESRESANVPSDERVLAWAKQDLHVGSVVIATDQAIYAQGGRIPWSEVIRAQWNEPFLELMLQDTQGRSQRLRLSLNEPAQLPDAIRTQVTANVVVSERLALDSGQEALAVARRQAGDAITWTVVFDAGVDAGDPIIRQQADLALAELRASLGI